MPKHPFRERIPKEIVLGRIFFTQNSTHANLPSKMCWGQSFGCHLGVFSGNVKKPNSNPKVADAHFFTIVFFRNCSLDKQIIKTKGNMQGSERFFLSLAFLVSCIFSSEK